MTVRVHALLALLLAAPLLAGCAADEPELPVAATPETILVTEANDEASLADESFMMAAHQHDYWGGADRLVVLDETIETSTTWSNPYWALPFLPEDGVVVPHGTKRVEITVSWVDGARNFYRDPELWIKTAADREAVLVGALASGDTLVLETSHANADLPHQGISAWRFEWRIHPAILDDTTWWEGAVTMKAEAVRGLDIPIYPPHPDLWNGAETLALFDDAADLGIWMPGGSACPNQCNRPHYPRDGATVPYDAAAVEVVLEPSAQSTTPLGLAYHGADTRDWIPIEPASEEGMKRTYVIPLGPGMGDSPYATQSVWEFLPIEDGPIADQGKVGTYTIAARVLRQPA